MASVTPWGQGGVGDDGSAGVAGIRGEAVAVGAAAAGTGDIDLC